MKSVNFDTESLTSQVLEQHAILLSKISTALNCDQRDVPAAVREVMRFLCLASENACGMLTPSYRVDLAWHEFILCTHAYQAFCETYFGKFIHHSPGGSEQDNRQQYQETLRRYRHRFGVPDEEYWPTGLESNCGACETT